jgi:nucleotide-binding universal stress UspA family protein
MAEGYLSYSTAVHDFRRARQRAALQEILGRLTGRPSNLLNFEEVRRRVRASGVESKTLREIPLDAIVGSVGRYADFTRTFLPRRDSDEERWARIKVATSDLVGLPPIELYQIGDVYFVLDGNHRVSVARQLGANTIQAYVTKLRTRVPLTPDVEPDELIIKEEYADFLEQTLLDELRPEADLSVTAPGQYRQLSEHIDVHRHFMGNDWQRHIPYEEAVTHWYDWVYLPIVRVLRERGILEEFPGRTETDLYLWIGEHRAGLAEELGWEVEPELIAAGLAEEASNRPRRPGVVSRVGERLLGAVLPGELNAGPPPGQWRRNRLDVRRDDRLFLDILVPVSGEAVGWYAVEQAIVVARREGGRLRGLHVTPSEEQAGSEEALAVRHEFNRRCQAAGVPGELFIEVGAVTDVICSRAQWTDLVVVNLAYPPGAAPLARLGSGFRRLVNRCARPILAAPGTTTALERPLLAYDGSPKAHEGLYIATYLGGRWGTPLVVAAVSKGDGTAATALEEARVYLEEHGVGQVNYVKPSPPVVEAILETAEGEGCDWLIMGGYGTAPVFEVVLGSVVDQVLRESNRPVLICR